MYGFPMRPERYSHCQQHVDFPDGVKRKERQMPNIIAWRESNRKAASDYAELPVGVVRSDYSIDMDSVVKDVQNELYTRAVAHLYNNEAISACIRMQEKAKDEGN